MTGTVHIVAADALPARPWRNGGGHTRELLTWPEAGPWRLRISLADIDTDGPFSAFPGVERWFAVIEGAGVELDFDGAVQPLRAGDEPLRFDGGAAPGCRLIDGATRDLNLMLQDSPGVMQRALPGRPWAQDWNWRGCFTTGPALCRLADGTALALAERCLAWNLGPGPLTLDSTDTSRPAFWIGAAA